MQGYLINEHGLGLCHACITKSDLLNLRGKINVKCMSLYFFLGHCRMVIVYKVHHQSVFLVIKIISMSYVGLHQFQYAVLLECLTVHSNVYSNFNSIFSCCLSQKSFNSFVSTDIVKSVKDEAIYNLKNGEYCSFLCMLALSTIIGTQINCIYPSIGQKKYRLLFNNVIKPRQCYSSSVGHVTTPISIMFSRIGINENCGEFVPNYFVPIIQDSRKS